MRAQSHWIEILGIWHGESSVGVGLADRPSPKPIAPHQNPPPNRRHQF
jgi:hypothetical protein